MYVASLVGYLWIGVDVAFYAALIGVPIVAILEPDIEEQAITIPVEKS